LSELKIVFISFGVRTVRIGVSSMVAYSVLAMMASLVGIMPSTHNDRLAVTNLAEKGCNEKEAWPLGPPT
jgi:hypothetical protein